MGENNDREYVARMFKRDDEVIDENVNMEEYINEFIENMNDHSETEYQKFDEDFDLLERCKDYLDSPTEENLEKFNESILVSSTMAAPVVYKFLNKYKNNPEYKNQCIILQQILMDYIDNNRNIKSI